MTDLAASLKRWHELEPERYGHKRSPLRERYIVVGGQTHFAPDFDQHLILAAVIEAVEVRGGEWVLRAGPNLWVAGVSLTAGKDAYWDGQGDSRESATHALLGAYLAALEAEAGQ